MTPVTQDKPVASASNSPKMVDVKLLDRKHEMWSLHSDQWNTIDILYEGGIKLKNNGSNLLMKRPKELYDVFQERYRRLTYEDILANCVRWYLAKLFQKEPQIEPRTTDPRFAAFLQDCDRAGTTFIQFCRNLLEKMFLFQVAFVLIDKPRPSDDAPVLTRADEQRQGLNQPYLVLYDPSQAINYGTDSYGNLTWVIFKLLTEVQDGPLAPKVQAVSWYIFDQVSFRHYRFELKKTLDDTSPVFNGESDQWAGTSAQATLITEGPHALTAQKRVPVRVCQFPRSLSFANASYLQLLEHLDYLNGYAWKLFLTCHPQLVVYSGKQITGQTLGETSFLQFDPTDKVEYLEPKGETFAECRAYLNLMKEEIYRSWHLQAQGRSSSATADGASGYSKEMEMAPAIDMLNAVGDQARNDQQNILLDYKAAASMPVDVDHEPSVNGYNFETTPALQQITIAQATLDLGLADKSPTLEKILDKMVAIPLLDGQNEADKAKVLDELDKAPSRKETQDAEEAAQQQAFQQKFQKSVSTNVLNQETASVA